jgi:hypothetical protein
MRGSVLAGEDSEEDDDDVYTHPVSGETAEAEHESEEGLSLIVGVGGQINIQSKKQDVEINSSKAVGEVVTTPKTAFTEDTDRSLDGGKKMSKCYEQKLANTPHDPSRSHIAILERLGPHLKVKSS